MKSKIVFLMVFVWTSVFAQGQLQKGMVMLGGTSNIVGNLSVFSIGNSTNNVGFQFGKTKTKYESTGFDDEYETKVTAFNFNPNVGIMATNNLMVGMSVGVFSMKIGEGEDEEKFTVTSFNPFVRGYFKNEGKILPYLEARGGITSIKYGDDDEDKESAPFFGGKLGGAIFLNSKVSLDLFVDYLYSKDKEEDGSTKITNTSSSFGFGLGFSVFL